MQEKKKRRSRIGTFMDVSTGIKVPVGWVGEWSVQNGSVVEEHGVAIPLRSLPRMEIDKEKIYHVKFDYEDPKGAFSQHLNEFVKFHKIEYICERGEIFELANEEYNWGLERPHDEAWHVLFKSIGNNNLEVIKRIGEEK